MREDEFRDRLRGALGETPPLAPPTYVPPRAAGRRLYPTAMGAIAVAVAVLLVLALLGTRLSGVPRGNVGPPAAASPSFAAAADAFPCALPVVVVGSGGAQGGAPFIGTRYGFLNLPAGNFRMDPAASTVNSPYAYSALFRRWLPTSTRDMSPSGTAYAYVKLVPEGASYSSFSSTELHVVDLASNVDRKVWSSPDGIDIILWRSAGILADTVPRRGGVRLLWTVDPIAGKATQAPDSSDPERYPTSLLTGGGNYSYMGSDPSGTSVFRLGSRDNGTRYKVVVVQNGQPTTIYSGTAGDAKNFDPGGTSFDAHGVWFSNFDGKLLWLWSRSSGLKSFPVSGLPAAPAGYQNTEVSFDPAGSCVPGAFAGVLATPFPAAGPPTPSPAPPVVDWKALTSRPLSLPPMASGGACPASPQVNLDVPTTTYNGKGGPNFGFGPGPSYVSGQTGWYSGTQGMIILVDAAYRGPILVRSRRLDGTAELGISGNGASAVDGGLGIPVTSAPPRWGMWLGSLSATAPGCYGIQIDGTSFTNVVVIEVKKGPPPPG